MGRAAILNEPNKDRLMKDSHNRTIQYLRISITDRCNLRCRYCMPESGIVLMEHEEILRYNEIVRLTRIMAGLGVDRVRLTGGEPLMRKGVEQLAEELKSIEGIEYLGITTNGTALEEKADALRKAGVNSVNISLDTTDPAAYERMTRRNQFDQAWKGIEASLAAGFDKVKINCVLSPYSADSDWLGVVGIAKNMPVDVKLIEWMPVAGEKTAPGIREPEARAKIEKLYGKLVPLGIEKKSGPADYWQAEGFAGRIGFIHAMSNCFCENCNRVRLTASGDLKLCLFYDEGVALKPLLRSGATDQEIAEQIIYAVKNKPERHRGEKLAAEDESGKVSLIESPCGMYGIGG